MELTVSGGSTAAAAAVDGMPAGAGRAVPGAREPIGIAVDGGGSKTDVVALSRTGQVLAQLRGGPSSPQALGVTRSLTSIAALIAEAVSRCDGSAVSHIGLYLSGLDLPSEYAGFANAFDELVRPAYPDAAVTIDNDLFALLRAGTRQADAVAVVCGTGINCVGVRADGAVVRYPALGTLSGDWGGGLHLGELALWHAARAVDGRGPETILARHIPVAFGRPALADVIEALHFGAADHARLADLGPVIFAAAESGDAVAAELVDRQATEIALFAASALRRLDLAGRSVPVVLGGGLIRPGHAWFLDVIRERLAVEAPLAWIVPVAKPPVIGAASLVLEAAGADDEAQRRLEQAVLD